MENSNQNDPHSQQERDAIRECLNEAFWKRSVPGAGVSAAVSLWAIKHGHIKNTGRFGAWPIVLGFGSVGYMIGKLSYVLGYDCQNIFLEKAPNSQISEHVRERRENNDPNLPYIFQDILNELDGNKISDMEAIILADCSEVAFYRYAVPMSIFSAATLYTSLHFNVLKPSKFITSYPRMPKTFAGGVLGYMMGRIIYAHSGDCPKRFLKYDYDGQISTILRKSSTNTQKYTSKRFDENIEAVRATDKIDTEDYVLPPENIDIEQDLSNSFTGQKS